MRRIRALTEDTEFLAVTVSKMAIGSGAAKNSVSRLLESATPGRCRRPIDPNLSMMSGNFFIRLNEAATPHNWRCAKTILAWSSRLPRGFVIAHCRWKIELAKAISDCERQSPDSIRCEDIVFLPM